MEWLRNTLSSVTTGARNTLDYYSRSEEPPYVGERDGHSFPKNAIVFIGTHGEIEHNSSIPTTFPVSTVNSIYKFNLAPNGHCSITDHIDVDYYGDIIKHNIKAFKNINTTNDEYTLRRFMENIKDNIKIDYLEELDKYKSEFPVEHEQKEESCQIIEFKRNDQIMLKSYSFKRSNEDISESALDWNITVLNTSPPYFDLFKAIKIKKGEPWRRYEYMTITTKDIIDYLSELGVVNILLFDFSCSVVRNLPPLHKEIILRLTKGKIGGKKWQRTYKKGLKKVNKNISKKFDKKYTKKKIKV